jgi:hypothetical protein
VNGNTASAAAAVEACLAFLRGDYRGALVPLDALFAGEVEVDAFSSWMRLVCGMELGGAEAKSALAPYLAIRARYQTLPCYWYFGARALEMGEDRGAWAERAVNLAPGGPYAAEAREILVTNVGLDAREAASIRTRYEIDKVVENAADGGRPPLLTNLLPLLALPDNPYTLYALNALRGLAANDGKFKAWFTDEAQRAAKAKSVRAAERLTYIARG